MTRTPRWDPDQYQRHGEHRGRPLRELLARVPPLPTAAPAAPRVADLGCGPGRPSLAIAERWPTAHITGYDNSPEMLARARRHAGPTPGGGRLDFAHADLTDWRPQATGEAFDLLVANAVLQWVPGHVARLPEWLSGLKPGGVLAFQVPRNADAPSHRLLRRLVASPRWSTRLPGPLRFPDGGLSAEAYLAALAPLGCRLDVWETTYHQLLRGEDPVLDWCLGTALRPVLTALGDDPEARDAFLAEYRDALRAAYPPGRLGTVYPFRRVFVVAQR